MPPKKEKPDTMVHSLKADCLDCYFATGLEDPLSGSEVCCLVAPTSSSFAFRLVLVQHFGTSRDSVQVAVPGGSE